LEKLLLTPALVKPHEREEDNLAIQRLRDLAAAWKTHAERLQQNDLSVLRELFDADFLTARYMLNELEILGAD
jgi:hypothetical protein